MFKLPNLPNSRAGIHELADFAEIRCWIDSTKSSRGGLSDREIVRYLVQMDDNSNSGVDDDEDAIRHKVSEVMEEISRRENICKGGYPFVQEYDGTVLKLASSRSKARQKKIYLYLLLCTRLDMRKKKIHADLDGTQLLERLSDHALKAYLGPDSKSMLFGTAAQTNFKFRVEELCNMLGEGWPKSNLRTHTGDGGLDTVGWIPFSDKNPGQLIVFGQSKTGTNWRDDTTRLQPRNFADLWLSDNFRVDPLRAYFVSESVDRSSWDRATIEAGILFDRCRLVNHSKKLPSSIYSEICKWTNAAAKDVAEEF